MMLDGYMIVNGRLLLLFIRCLSDSDFG